VWTGSLSYTQAFIVVDGVSKVVNLVIIKHSPLASFEILHLLTLFYLSLSKVFFYT